MKVSGLSIAGFVISIAAIPLVVIPIFGPLFFVLSFIFSLLGLFRSSKKGFSIVGIIISVLFVHIGLLATLGIFAGSTDTEQNEEPYIQQESQDESVDKEEESAPEIQPEELRKQFIDSCIEIDYDELRRNPEDHIGKNVVITVCVRQILEGHHKGKDVWRAYTDDSGYGLYYGDEYFLIDYREVNDLNIITEDILIIYGTFEGMESVNRIIGSDDKLPRISVKYLELID